MSIGVSTSCYYPLETEKAFQKIASLGVKTCEIFFNSFSELEKPFLADICRIRDEYGMRIPSLHPFFSFGEPYLLFSEYERRFHDTMELYKKYFEAANVLGSTILVMHGGKASNYVSDELYFERFAALAQAGRAYGVTVAQENVLNFRSQSPTLLFAMKAFIGSDFKMVLDIKQAARAGYTAFEFVHGMAESIAHIHISDLNDRQDCMPPGEGYFDFVRLFAEMDALDYKGDYIIELYRHNFEEDSQILSAKRYTEGLAGLL